MRFSYAALFLIALLGLASSSLRAQPEAKLPKPADVGVINDIDVTVTDLTEEKLNHPPKREFKVERVDEPLKQPLFKPDAKRFEQKYAASFRLKTVPYVVHGNGWNFVNYPELSGDVAKLRYVGDWSLINFDLGRSSASKMSIGESFALMNHILPAGTSFSQEDLEFLPDPQGTKSLMYISRHREPKQGGDSWTIAVYGTTAEEAERRTKTLLTLLDHGACRPIRLEIFKKREPLCVQLRAQRKLAEEAPRMINAIQDQLKSYVDFTPDMLSNLRVQQLQLDVDLAGVKARIAACDRLLAGAAPKPERRSQIEDLKVAAEIEFAGFEARLTKSNEIISKVKTKVDLLSKLATAEAEQKKTRTKCGRLEEEIKFIDASIHAYAPLPLVDNKITVQPLEWTQ